MTVSKPDRGALVAEDGPLIKPHVWVRIAVLGALFVLLFWDILWRAYGFGFTDGGLTGRGWAWVDGNWSHALVVPLISLYFLYQHREQLKAAVIRASWLGFVLMIVGIVCYFLGIYPIRNDMAKGYSMIMALGGLVWFLCGGGVARLAWFPVFYLVFAIKVSDRAWEIVAFKLQQIAAKVSGVAINVLGLPISLEADVRGNTIELWHHGVKLGSGLNVAEACSGLRMLMTFIALGFAVAYLADRPWWSRLTLVLLTVPIAILINVGRVTTLGLIYPYNEEMATGEFHIFVGMLMLIPALGLFMLVGWTLDQLFVAETKPEERRGIGS